MNEPAGKVYPRPLNCQPERSKVTVAEVLYSSTYSALATRGLNMISLMTTCPAGEGRMPLYTALTLLLVPAMIWPWMSTPTTLNWLVPGCSGTVTVQLVTLVQVRGHSTPLNQMVFTFTGAGPL